MGMPDKRESYGFLAPLERSRRGQTTERVERVWIKAALVESGWSRTSTAERLGINRKTLFNKMKLYGLLAEGEPEPE